MSELGMIELGVSDPGTGEDAQSAPTMSIEGLMGGASETAASSGQPTFLDHFTDEATRGYMERKGFKDVQALGASFASLERMMSSGRVPLPAGEDDAEGYARAFAALLARRTMISSKFFRDLFTGVDGQTWAIGRVYSLPMLLCGLALPFLAVLRGQSLDLMALGGLFGGLGAGVWALIRGTSATEPMADKRE